MGLTHREKLLIICFVGIFAAFEIIKTALTSIDGSAQSINSKINYYPENDEFDLHPLFIYHGPIKELPYAGLPALAEETSRQYLPYSQVGQDKIIIELMKAMGSVGTRGSTPNGKHFFIDLAANDAVQLSNTLMLEETGEWNGLCIEGNPVYWYRLGHRKCALIGAFVGGSEDGEKVQVSIGNEAFAGIIKDKFKNNANKLKDKATAAAAIVEDRYTMSLESIFTKFEVPDVIDYFSLDVEGAEYLIMKDFPFHLYKINFMTIERPGEILMDLMKEKDYIFISYISCWHETIWAHESILEVMKLEKMREIVSGFSAEFMKKCKDMVS